MSDVNQNSGDDFTDSVMIALLPMTTNWCNIKLPHMTLVYAGLVKDLKPTTFNEMAKDTASIAIKYPAITLQVTGIAQFGDDVDGKVDVLTLRPTPALLGMRKVVESWNESQYDFSPHATIGPVGSLSVPMPKLLAFDRIMVSWGSDDLIFWLKNNNTP